MKVWEKLKSESKIYYEARKRSCTDTGGGPPELKVDPVLEQVCALLGRAFTGILGVQDCDAEEQEIENVKPPKRLCFEQSQENIVILQSDISGSILSQILTQPDNNEFIENSNVETITADNETPITKTPLWSRRRPQIAQNNERTEAINSMCSSFNNVNKRKQDIEDLKKTLFEEEIIFKRKLYEFQLQAAAKEVEIKNETLNQIRGGGKNLQNLFVAATKVLNN